MTGPVAIRVPAHPLPRLDRVHLRGLPSEKLAAWVAEELGGPGYRARQVFEWLHRHRVRDPEAMTNLPAADRARLAQRGDTATLETDAVQRASDGTIKLRLRTGDGHAIETVLIPNEDRGLTQCISSMVGCSLTCDFCATASMGFIRNLAAWEIVDQVYRAQDLLEAEARERGEKWPDRVTNLVLMGMGEPLHNYNQVRDALAVIMDPLGAAISGRRITVSTAGLVPGIERFGREGMGSNVGLAVSLNATTDETRDRLMPINTRWNIAELLRAVRAVPAPDRRRVTLEYVLMADTNDSDADVQRLAALVDDIRCQVNVIPFNPHPHAPYRRPTPERVEAFVQGCRDAGLRVFVRTPRGDDIAAACGQLALEDPK